MTTSSKLAACSIGNTYIQTLYINIAQVVLSRSCLKRSVRPSTYETHVTKKSRTELQRAHMAVGYQVVGPHWLSRFYCLVYHPRGLSRVFLEECRGTLTELAVFASARGGGGGG